MRRNPALAALLALVVLLIAATGADRLQARTAGEEAKGTVLINITSGKEDLHAVTMALQLAVHALDGRGKRTQTVPTRTTGNTTTFTLEAKHKTLWYELVKAGN